MVMGKKKINYIVTEVLKVNQTNLNLPYMFSSEKCKKYKPIEKKIMRMLLYEWSQGKKNNQHSLQLQTSPSLKFYSVAYRIYNFIYKVFFIQNIHTCSFFLEKKEQTGRDWFEIVPKTTRLSCLMK